MFTLSFCFSLPYFLPLLVLGHGSARGTASLLRISLIVFSVALEDLCDGSEEPNECLCIEAHALNVPNGRHRGSARLIRQKGKFAKVVALLEAIQFDRLLLFDALDAKMESESIDQ